MNLPFPRRLLAAVLVLFTGVAVAAGPAAYRTLAVRPAASSGTVVVPDQFLRAWDPLTVFFSSDAGSGAGPEDDPGRWVQLSPEQPGAWTWLDRRTLQFRPAEPWQPLTRYTVNAGGVRENLVTLMAPPTSTMPRDGSTGLSPVESLTLTFREPMDPELLAQAVRIELRELPGLDATGARWLTAEDFTIKSMERTRLDAPSTYVLTLDDPIEMGTAVTVHFRLSLDDTEESFARVDFSTAEPFRVSGFGCMGDKLPVAPGGSTYPVEQVLSCAGGTQVQVQFSARVASIDPIVGRNLVRFEPAVDDLEWNLSGSTLTVQGDFDRETLYKVTVADAELHDEAGRRLEHTGIASGFVVFPRLNPYLRFEADAGTVERYGPQTVPMTGRGHGRADVRVHVVDPLDRTFWPWPGKVVVDEAQRPAGPGEEPEPLTEATAQPSSSLISQHLHSLGTPTVSELVDLPLREEGSAARFGLDLSDVLAQAGGKNQPGTYLVGLRSLDGRTQRSWMRVQVTDLALTSVEESDRVNFAVTSLSSGKPMPNATVSIEGVQRVNKKNVWKTLYTGRTDSEGLLSWRAPGTGDATVRRIVVKKDRDTLVLDAQRPPDQFTTGHWHSRGNRWLDWAFDDLESRAVQPETLCHLFSERPIYRPEEPTHLKGYARRRTKGRLEVTRPEATLRITGPGAARWEVPVEWTKHGSFYHRFEEELSATGTYYATLDLELEGGGSRTCGRMSWEVEAYRLPRFEVTLTGPEQAALDAPFEVDLAASYYAGGQVAGQPVLWRVTQYPYTWSPNAREGFLYSSDGRYSQAQRFDATPEQVQSTVTDAGGGAVLTLDPTLEPTAQPRVYAIEATVTGADDQTVSATERVIALPPFVLGLKVPRYLDQVEAIPVELLAAGPDGELVEGQPITVRLLSRQWHSRLQASDFSNGQARYVTDVVDEVVREQEVLSGPEPTALDLPIDGSGVYLVELESRDRLGRAQVVRIDLYAGGAEPMAWKPPEAGTFQVNTDQASYVAGDTAKLVLASPWQNANALIVVEAPEGNVYHWQKVRGGQATFKLPIQNSWAPRLPVHVVLMRGRTDGSGPDRQVVQDLGKPMTIANTTWLQVDPADNRVSVELSHPERALPGSTIDMTVTLADRYGEPTAGEVTLWLVDRAVLALATEQKLDPMDDFIKGQPSRLGIRDTRNDTFGEVPYAQMPGGDEGDAERSGLMDKVTVRKNFQPVPYYEPALQVPASGKLTVQVTLPDNLTDFAVRAKALTDPDKFGVAKSIVKVRLPLIVQPALPRFVRPGDTFSATAIGRVVEGDGGEGMAQLQVTGATPAGPDRMDVQWDAVTPRRLSFPVTVDGPQLDDNGQPVLGEVQVTVAVQRQADGASDAFQVSLPVRPDRRLQRQQQLFTLARGAAVDIAGLREEAWPGSVRRDVMVASDPGLLTTAAALDYQLSYPFGCTEQRIARARSLMALGSLREQLSLGADDAAFKKAVEDTLVWLPDAVTPSGLVAFWPGGPGYVSLTAWSLEFLVEAEDAGFPVDGQLRDRLIRSLRASLRSDARFVDGGAYAERTAALQALAMAGSLDQAYFAELARRATYTDAEGTASVVLAAYAGGQAEAPVMPRLGDVLDQSIIVKLQDGRERYAGLQDDWRSRSGRIVPSETRSLARITRALFTMNPNNTRMPLLLQALYTLGSEDGWGSTNANTEALLTLGKVLATPDRHPAFSVDVSGSTLSLGATDRVARLQATEASAGTATLDGADAAGLRVTTSWLPATDASQRAPLAQGYVVTRELGLVVEGAPKKKIDLAQGGTTVPLAVGDVVEDHVQVVNSETRYHVAIIAPLAAGFEPLNPRLATSGAEARPDQTTTLAPTYVAYLDDQVAWFYDELPKGTYDFAFRARAQTPGSYVQPPARAESMYRSELVGSSAGARIEVKGR